MTKKFAILFISLLFWGGTSNASEIRKDNFSKLDSLVSIHARSVSAGDSTIVVKKPFQTSAIIGFSSSLLAIFSWVLQLAGSYTVISVFFNPLVLGIVGLVFSIIALSKIKKTRKSGKKLAKAGIILTILHALSVIGVFALVLFALSKFT